jgi:hypothetical protein
MQKTLVLSIILAGTIAFAEEGASAPPAATEEAKPAEAAPAEKPWYQKVKLEGTVDGYYGIRFQGTPAQKADELRVFDGANNTFSLGYGKIALSLPAEPAGFRLDLGFGPIADATSSDYGNPTATEMLKHVQQAFGTVKLFNTLTVDVGKFVTSAGAEVIEAKDNWLYSRSMLFGFAIPFAHTGLRLSLPIGSILTLQGSIVNGWDNVINSWSYKTFNLSAMLALSTGTNIYLNFYGGPDKVSTDTRLLFDVVVNQAIGEKVALNLNGDYGVEGSASWYGASLMGKVMLADWLRLAARLEYFADPQGFRTGVSGGASFVTATVGAGFIFAGPATVELRPELRHDQALGGATPYVAGTSASQTTLQVSAIAWF